MIRTYLELELKPGAAEGLASLFERERILETSADQEGCHSAELTISDDGLIALVTATWSNREAYDTWTSRADRSTQADELNSFLRRPVGPETVGRVFDVVRIANASSTA